ncbi:MAG: transporter substrate-binding domain-containing protein [Egibacteraceae bacterium]
MNHTVNVRRPWAYLCIGICLAIVALVVPGSPAPVIPSASAEPVSAPRMQPQIACQPVDRPPVGSLRPKGPLPGPGNMPPGSTMARIAERGRLKVAVDQSKHLSGFRDSTGELRGFDIEVAYGIAEAIFGDTENRVQFIVTNIGDRKDVILSGEVDLVVNHFSITCARQRDVEFSTGYMEAFQRILVPKGSEVDSVDDLMGTRVCTSRGSTNNETIERLLNRPVEQVPNVADCLVLLQQGRIDAITSDEKILAGLASEDPRMEIVGAPLAQAWYGVGMSKTTPDLVRFVNGVLEESFADGTWAERYDRWYGEYLGPAPAPPPTFYRD